MKLGFSQQEIERTAVNLGLPSNQSFINRRIARAFDLVNTDKVTEVTDGIFRIRSQYEPDKSYIVNVNHGAPYCDCPDGERTINCKHRIASLLYQARQAKSLIVYETTRDDDSFIHRSWLVIDSDGWRHTVIEENNRFVHCTCRQPECEHIKAVINHDGGNGNGTKRIANECGTERAKELQNQLNHQSDSQNDNGNIEQVRAKKQVEANEQPAQNADGKRRLQMTKDLRTWLIEADGTKTAISCREIAEQYDSREKGIIKRLRAGIDSGADLSTVELD